MKKETQYTQDNRNQNHKIHTNTGAGCGIGQDNGQAKAGPTEDHYPDVRATLILPPVKQNGESSAEFLL